MIISPSPCRPLPTGTTLLFRDYHPLFPASNCERDRAFLLRPRSLPKLEIVRAKAAISLSIVISPRSFRRISIFRDISIRTRYWPTIVAINLDYTREITGIIARLGISTLSIRGSVIYGYKNWIGKKRRKKKERKIVRKIGSTIFLDDSKNSRGKKDGRAERKDRGIFSR